MLCKNRKIKKQTGYVKDKRLGSKNY